MARAFVMVVEVPVSAANAAPNRTIVPLPDSRLPSSVVKAAFILWVYYKDLLKDQERVIERFVDPLGKVEAEEVIGKPGKA